MAQELRSRRDIPTDEEGLIEQYGGTVLTAGSGLLVGFIVGRLTASGSKNAPVALVELAESIRPKLQVLNRTQYNPRIQDSNAALTVINNYITALESSYEGLAAASRQQGTIPTQLLSRAGYNIATIAELEEKLEFEEKFYSIWESLYSMIRTQIIRASSTSDTYAINNYIAYSGKLSWFLMTVKSLYLSGNPNTKNLIKTYIDKVYEFISSRYSDPIVDIFFDANNNPPLRIADVAESYLKGTLNEPLDTAIKSIINASIMILNNFKNQGQSQQ